LTCLEVESVEDERIGGGRGVELKWEPEALWLTSSVIREYYVRRSNLLGR